MKAITIKQPWATLIAEGLINKGDWDGYGFKLENIEKINPIEVNGKLSLWDYDNKS